jgi:ADP-ribosylglycohydrolase
MLLELAIGDAYGAGFEYASEMMKYNDLSRYVQHPRHLGTRPGMYTDDTQMSLAIAEMALAAGSCCEEVAQDLPQHLIDGLENGPYGRDYLRALDARLMEFAAS